MKNPTGGALWHPFRLQLSYMLREPGQPVSLEYLARLEEALLPNGARKPPVVLPFGDDMPREFPRALLSLEDESVRVEIAPLRTNVTLHHLKGAPIDSMPPLAVYEEIGGRVAKLVAKEAYKPIRLGAVSELIRCTPGQEPALFLSRHFFKDAFHNAPFNRPATLEIHSHKVFELDKFRVNSWVRVKSMQFDVVPKGAEPTAILFHSDINTVVAESVVEFGSDQVSAFYNAIPAAVAKVRNQYFPNQDN